MLIVLFLRRAARLTRRKEEIDDIDTYSPPQ